MDPPIHIEQNIKSIWKKEEDIYNFKFACKIAGEAVRLAVDSVKPGITTEDIDKVVHDYIISQNAYPTPIKYMGFPKSVCTSVNEGIIILLIYLFLFIYFYFIFLSCLSWDS